MSSALWKTIRKACFCLSVRMTLCSAFMYICIFLFVKVRDILYHIFNKVTQFKYNQDRRYFSYKAVEIFTATLGRLALISHRSVFDDSQYNPLMYFIDRLDNTISDIEVFYNRPKVAFFNPMWPGLIGLFDLLKERLWFDNKVAKRFWCWWNFFVYNVFRVNTFCNVV